MKATIGCCTSLALTLLGAAFVSLSGGCSDTAATARAAPAQAPAAGAGPATNVDLRGVAIQITTAYNPVETYGPLLREIAGLGANTVLLSPAAYMEHARAQSIVIDALKTPAAEDFKNLIREARKLKLRVILMPIVLLRYPRGSEWRGVIEPPDWGDWWRDYRDYVAYCCDIARDGGAEILMVGSELVSTEKYTNEWLSVVELARTRFGGKLGYSANWDHYEPVKFWDKLDYVGMTSYYTLADKRDPSIDDIAKRWQPIRRDILEWLRKVNKPLILTEVGWCSQEGAATAPWNYYQNQKATPAGHEEQRRLYEAFIRAWKDTPELAGVIWWEWSGAAGGAGDYGYTPKAKPAEQVLRNWFGQHAGGQGMDTDGVEGTP